MTTTPPLNTEPVRPLTPPGVLPLDLPPGLGPFTPSDAARRGVSRSALERMVRDGRVVRLVRGVYLDASRPCPPSVRAEALAMAVGSERVACGLTAAWVLGAGRPALAYAAGVPGGDPGGPLPLEMRGRRERRLGPDEMVRVGSVLATAPVRTAIDLARRLDLDRAVAVTDALLRARVMSHVSLLEAAQVATGPGSVNVRQVAARAEARSAGPAESVLRLRWHDARLPTPIPGFAFGGLRVALALPSHRFAVAVAGLLTERHRGLLRTRGWRVVELRGSQVLTASARALSQHLEREFHQHLLEEVG
ncbi:MAG: type IV toxin-antitoxin system AbiEi family antitoxin domain-containing protein [Nocardioidaceae bacterium]|nr:type IV toxin-antitoxin system AbiEi family antitoxin domain-containing protein [Nocardioidaceae bacterium]